MAICTAEEIKAAIQELATVSLNHRRLTVAIDALLSNAVGKRLTYKQFTE